MSSLLVGLIGIAAFFVLLILRMPIAYGMALVGFVGFSCLASPAAAFRVVAKDIFIHFPLIR